MHLLPLFISMLWGYALILLCCRKELDLHFSLIIPLSITLGFGATITTTFLTLLIVGHYSQTIIISTNILFIFATYLILIILYKQGKIKFIYPKSFKWAYLFFIIIWGILTAGISYIATTHPFGEWDAWAIWNMKSRFIIYGADAWQNMFTEMHWHTHPDYPLYLPILNTWVYAWTGEPFYTGPMITTVFWTISCGLLLFGALRQFIPKSVSFIVATLFMAHPYYVFLATSQYSDVIIAFYLLSAFALCVLTFTKKSIPAAILMGLTLGFMTFVKNEGLVMAILLLLLTWIYLMIQKDYSWKEKWQTLGFSLGSFIITFIPYFILRKFLAPSNDDILPDLNWVSIKMTNWDTLFFIKNAYVLELLGKPWIYAWPFIFILLFLGIFAIFRKECKILTFFFIFYFFIVIGIYLFTQREVSLQWWLDFSLTRILLTQFPAVLFLIFYAHWRKKPEQIYSMKSQNEIS